MDLQALLLSLKLAAVTTVLLIPVSICLARWLAWTSSSFKGVIEAFVALPLVLPPTVLGYYLLIAFSRQGLLGSSFEAAFGSTLAFSFVGLVFASLLFNLPFAVQPMQRAFEGIDREIRESAWCCGLNRWQTFRRVELPLGKHGVIAASLLVFAHTVGEFGVVLMVGGNIPGVTRTVSIAIFDQVESFNDTGAAQMSGLLLISALVIIGCVFSLNRFHSGSRSRHA